MLELANRTYNHAFAVPNPIIFNPVLPSYTTFNDKLDALTRGTESFLGDIWDWIVNLFKKIFGMSGKSSSKSDTKIKHMDDKLTKLRDKTESDTTNMDAETKAKFDESINKQFAAVGAKCISREFATMIMSNLKPSIPSLNAFGASLKTQCDQVLKAIPSVLKLIQDKDADKLNAVIDKFDGILRTPSDLAMECVQNVANLGFMIETTFPSDDHPFSKYLTRIVCRIIEPDDSKPESLDSLGYKKDYKAYNKSIETAILSYRDGKKRFEFATTELASLVNQGGAFDKNSVKSVDADMRVQFAMLKACIQFIAVRVMMYAQLETCITTAVIRIGDALAALLTVVENAKIQSRGGAVVTVSVPTADPDAATKLSKNKPSTEAYRDWTPRSHTPVDVSLTVMQAACQLSLHQTPDRDIADNGLSCLHSIGSDVMNQTTDAVVDLMEQLDRVSRCNSVEQFSGDTVPHIATQLHDLNAVMSEIYWMTTQLDRGLTKEIAECVPTTMQAARKEAARSKSFACAGYVEHLKTTQFSTETLARLDKTCNALESSNANIVLTGDTVACTANAKRFFTEQRQNVLLLHNTLQQELLAVSGLSQRALPKSITSTTSGAETTIVKAYNVYADSVATQMLSLLERVAIVQRVTTALADLIRAM